MSAGTGHRGSAGVPAEALAAAPPLNAAAGHSQGVSRFAGARSGPVGRRRFCHHLGVLLFSAVLLGVEKQVAAGGWLLKQWLATLLLGAVNIEQTKLLDFEDLQRLLGRTLRSLFPQRNS